MNAEMFLKSFRDEVASESPSGMSAVWTSGMYGVLVNIGEKAGYQVYYKKHPYEINNIDFVYAPAEGDIDTNWNPPAVIIEHENAWDIEATKWDFWKACLYAAPLRVIIGYKRTELDSQETGNSLVEFYTRCGLRQLPDGETLLIMGWVQESSKRDWHTWTLKGDDEAFTYKTL